MGCISLPSASEVSSLFCYAPAYESFSDALDIPDVTKTHSRQRNNFKQLLEFVKPPGRKTMFIQVATEQLVYIPVDLAKLKKISGNLGPPERKYSTRMSQLECKLTSLFDENEVLPIKNAHMTVEIIIK